MKRMQPVSVRRAALGVGSAALLAAVGLGGGVAPVVARSGHANVHALVERAQKRQNKAARKAARLDTQREPVRGTVDRGRVTANDVVRIARANGYNQGFDQGTVDKRKGARSSYNDAREYQKGVTGYNDDFNNLSAYRNAFRAGYAAGYRDAYGRRNRNLGYDYRVIYRNYPWYRNPYYDSNAYYRNDDPRQWVPTSYNDGGYGDYSYVDDRRGDMDPEDVARRAAQNGYTAGFQRGQYDAARDRGRANPNPQGHGAYQFGLDGWNREWGSGATYQRYYRQYFIQGYGDAYQQRRRSFVYRRL